MSEFALLNVRGSEALLKRVAQTCCDTFDRRAACIWARIVPTSNLGAHSLECETVRAQKPK